MVTAVLGVSAQDILAPVAGEYRVSGELGGNQVASHVSFSRSGGYVVWQDDSLDEDGTSIGAQLLNDNLSGKLSPFRVNSITAGNQEKPRIATLADDGGAVVVWQSGSPGRQNIYLRILRSDGTFLATESRVNQFAEDFQINPSVVALKDGNVVVTWDSYGQDGHLRAVMARVFNSEGTALGHEFRVNQSIHLNQRNTALAAMGDGGFVVAWISERVLGQDQFGGAQFATDVMIRLYDAEGVPQSNELRASEADELCANPTVVANDSGGFTMAWSQSSTLDRESGWNIQAAGFSSTGQKTGGEYRVNSHEFGDQYVPRLARQGVAILAVWTSLGQDGSYEGVYGRAISAHGQPVGQELAVNSLTFNRQLHPSVAADEDGRFLVIWSDYKNGGSGFNLHAQRLASADPLPVLPAPFVSALSSTKLAVSWPALAGYEVDRYELLLNGSEVQSTTNQTLTVGGLLPGSTHALRLRYRLRDGRSGELSPEVTAKTWSEDENFDGLPDNWQEEHWGPNTQVWPGTRVDSDHDGASNLEEFLAGTDPTDAQDVLTVSIENRGGAVWVAWNTRPGLIYEVQHTVDMQTWNVFGQARLAPDNHDQVNVDRSGRGLFRIVRRR